MGEGTGKPSTGPANAPPPSPLPSVPLSGSSLWERAIGALLFSMGTVAKQGQAGWAPGR